MERRGKKSTCRFKVSYAQPTSNRDQRMLQEKWKRYNLTRYPKDYRDLVDLVDPGGGRGFRDLSER